VSLRKRLHHALHRIAHYANPVTHIKAAIHLTTRAVRFTERQARKDVRTVERAGHFTERQARKDYIKFNRVTASVVQVVTPIIAFVAELVPVFGLVLGPVVAGLGALVARVSDSVALRSQGVTGLHNRQLARGKERRTLKYGLYGSAAGGLASAAGLSLASGADSAEAGIDASAATTSQPTISASGAPNVGGEVSLQGAGQDVLPSVASNTVGAGLKAAEAGTDASTGILGTGVTWSQVGAVASPLVTVAQSVLKSLGIGTPKPAGQQQPGAQLVGSGSGGTEGTGDTSAGGPLGALADDLAGLPLPVKLGAAALGAGVVVYALTQGRKAA
jgi:hypothetical protein